MLTAYNLIEGELIAAKSGALLSVVDPMTEQKIATIPDSEEEEADMALKSAERAFEGWANLSAEGRARYLLKIADLIDERRADLAKLESLNTGKPYSLAFEKEIPRAAENFRFFGHAISSQQSETFDMGNIGFNYVLRQPLGPVVCIAPWNLPLYLLTWKIAPALAAGCTVVAKPSEISPLTAFALAEICLEAGLPSGVLNIVHGTGAKLGEKLVSHPLARGISFTGGTETGKKIGAIASQRLVPMSLELGGKNPALVFNDCDLDKTVSQIIRAAFTNSGQICLCASRILVEEKIYNSFKDRFLHAARQLKVGNPMSEGTHLGPLITREHREKVQRYVDLAEKSGAQILLDGRTYNTKDNQGYFFGPTIIEGLSLNHPVNQEEIFGPVVSLTPFRSEAEAIEMANNSKYGLSATVWTADLGRAHRLSRQLEVGIVWINSWLHRDLRTPFGGKKFSGIGREGGAEALRFFTEPKNICVIY
jgi:aminomuconate-semialdehyde/2-hydroxymuconate-6-semialdehyde dehydrogenase